MPTAMQRPTTMVAICMKKSRHTRTGAWSGFTSSKAGSSFDGGERSIIQELSDDATGAATCQLCSAPENGRCELIDRGQLLSLPDLRSSRDSGHCRCNTPSFQGRGVHRL